MKNLSLGFELDRYKNHDISLIVDRALVNDKNKSRIQKSISLAFKKGKKRNSNYRKWRNH